MKLTKKSQFFRGLSLMVALSASALALLFVFWSYASSEENDQLDATKVFTSSLLFNQIRTPISNLSLALNAIAESKVSIKRIENFLGEPEPEDYPAKKVDESAIDVSNADFMWNELGETNPMFNKDKYKPDLVIKIDDPASAISKPLCLTNITFSASRGVLVGICGSSGCAKSSLLLGLLGEAKRSKGRVYINDSICYCAQHAWLLNTTIKENITFGLPLDKARYQQAVFAAALTDDLKALQFGDLTLAGQSGCNLSGGQKQRVALARAVYANADIVLLDDPLSAVDSRNARHIFENLILGALKNRTRLFVTNQLRYLDQCHRILFLHDGKIVEQGSFDELTLKKDDHTYSNEEENQETLKAPNLIKSGLEDNETEYEPESEEDEGKSPFIENRSMQMKSGSFYPPKKEETKPAATIASTRVNTETLKLYFHASGYFHIFTLLFFSLLVIGLGFAADKWLSIWSQNSGSLFYYVIIFAVFTTCLLVSALGLGLISASASVRASFYFHHHFFFNIMKAPLSFFDSIPLGEIIHNCSKELDCIDSLLMENLRQMLFCLLEVLGPLLMIGIYNPWFLIAVPFILVIYYRTQKYYRASSARLKSLDSQGKSALLAHFQESLAGAITIRSFQQQQSFMNENKKRIDTSNRAYYYLLYSSRWLAQRLELLASFVVFLICLLGIWMKSSIDPSILGLSLSYGISLSSKLSFLVRQIVEFENNINSVERMRYYINQIPSENAFSTESDQQLLSEEARSSLSWPAKGCIEISALTMRYRPHLDPVLADFSVKIKAGWKVGIIGRSGAGKSSLLSALFRLVEIEKGWIKIDGVDIQKLGLSFLRSRLAILPQEPALFSGTLRSNLDPLNQFSDDQLHAVLAQVHLSAHIEKLDQGLYSYVNEKGENFSSGQRAQICLARALLKKAKILVIDEGTASLDPGTDALIQETLKQLQDVTIISIAHRLHTIIDYDRILVLSYGKMIEFDSPANLLRNENSHFASMIAHSGSRNAALLKSLAFRVERKKDITVLEFESKHDETKQAADHLSPPNPHRAALFQQHQHQQQQFQREINAPTDFTNLNFIPDEIQQQQEEQQQEEVEEQKEQPCTFSHSKTTSQTLSEKSSRFMLSAMDQPVPSFILETTKQQRDK